MRTAALVAGTATTLGLSFLTQVILIARIGAGQQSDAFYAAAVVPQFFAAVLCEPLAQVIIPMLSRTGQESFWSDAWAVVVAFVVAFGSISLVLFLTASLTTGLLFPGFEGDGPGLTAGLSRIMVWATFIGMIGTAMRSVSHANDSFLWPNMSSALGAIAGLAWLLWTLPTAGVWAGAWSTVVRLSVESALLLFGMRPAPLRFDRALLQKAVSSARPLWASNLFFRFDLVLDRALAAMAPVGTLSLFALAQQLLSAIGQVVNRGALAPVLPKLSQIAARRDWSAFRSTYTSYLSVVAASLTGILLLILVAGEPALRAMVEFRADGDVDSRTLWLLVVLLGGLLVGDSTSYLLSATFYAIGDTTTPSRIGAVSYSFGFALKLFGFFVAGVRGLALATSVFYVTRACMLWRAIESSAEQRIASLSRV